VWVAICEPYDEPGLWAVAGLRRLGLPLEVLLPDELVDGAVLVHRVGARDATVELRLRRGLVLRSGDVRGVLNRLLDVPEPPLLRLRPEDRAYAAEEFGAALASWLASLTCPVLNRPTPAGLGGPWRTPGQWRWMAAQVGLPALPWRLASWDESESPPVEERRSVVVVGDAATGALPDGLASGCVALAQVARAGLLGVELASGSDGGWYVDTATPLPDLRSGGRAALEGLRRALAG
jgi:hypothetical protein